MKRIIVCCDGTWNTSEEQDHRRSCPTNVAKIAQLIEPVDDHGVHQITHYHDGLGSGNSDKIVAGSFGLGISHAIQDAYGFLAANYAAGDEIWLFGFSRGAYTARSIVGLIRNSGLVTKEHLDKIPFAYELYRNRSPETRPDSGYAKGFKASFAVTPGIRFLGVWDTVGALGIPDHILSRCLSHQWSFHDLSLSSIVEYAYHAVALDERRADFKPCLWNHAEKTTSEQVWFPGVHSDVGGGYQEAGLSDCALAWMVCKARNCGLSISPAAREVSADPAAELHTLKKGLFERRGEYLRTVQGGTISWSAQVRRETAEYAPANWPTAPHPQHCPNGRVCRNLFRCH